MYRIITSILFVIWLTVGFLIILLVYKKQIKSIKNKVQYLIEDTYDNSVNMKNINNLLEEYHRIASIIVLNNKNEIIISSYNHNRINKKIHFNFMNGFKSQTPFKRKYKNHNIYTITDNHKNKILIALTKNLQIHTFYSETSKMYPEILAYIIAYFLIGFLILFIMINMGSIQKNLKPDPLTSSILNNIHEKEKINTLPNKIEDKFQLALEQITNIFPCDKLTFYLIQNDEYIPIIQKYQNIFIKGASLLPRPEIIFLVEKHQKVNHIISKNKTYEMIIPVLTIKYKVGFFYFQFTESQFPLNRNIKIKLKDLCVEYALNFYSEISFEEASYDIDSRFHNFDFFHTNLKQKMQSSKPFFCYIFQINNIKDLSKEKIYDWSCQVKCLIDDHVMEDASFGARVSKNTFIIVFDHFNTQKKLLRIIKDLYNLNNKYLHHKHTNGALVVKPQDMYDINVFIKRLEFGLSQSKIKHEFCYLYLDEMKTVIS